MCEHDWEITSKHADGTGDLYIYSICVFCGQDKEEVIDELD